jgi:hypothetical protein
MHASYGSSLTPTFKQQAAIALYAAWNGANAKIRAAACASALAIAQSEAGISKFRGVIAMARSALAGIVLVACAGSASAAFAQERPLDRGGQIRFYIQKLAAASGQLHEIRGDCMSACTIWLGHKPVCVAPDATLWFHQASDPRLELVSGNPWHWKSETGNLALSTFYPPRVLAVVRTWLESPEFHTLSGRELIALGIPECRR